MMRLYSSVSPSTGFLASTVADASYNSFLASVVAGFLADASSDAFCNGFLASDAAGFLADASSDTSFYGFLASVFAGFLADASSDTSCGFLASAVALCAHDIHITQLTEKMPFKSIIILKHPMI
ncbi:hypothetical protein AVEN_126742-1 [Araneus ventricosus]|uniref:Uncharacterized protein n=1 Tax=Araneus ventricosus TaxID=182803 RepID=A0A4Y2SZT7_ARAVE|nr:hypothetical protein AVEN_126742-1 [Araneus ventricosus]